MASDMISIKSIQEEIDKAGAGWTATENELTRMTAAERKGHLGLVVDDAEMQRLRAQTASLAAAEQSLFAAKIGAPTSVDWRNNGGSFVTPVKNQGGCGSCVSFCTCAVIESAIRIRRGDPNFAIDLSEAFMQFCGGGSCGGWGLTSGLEFAQSTGTTDEACMPYQARDMNCGSERCSDWASRLTKIKSFSGYATMAARKDAIATKGPLLAGMAVYDDFFALGSQVYIKANNTLAGYHCISVVGYSDTLQAWLIKNSWGTTWGMSGFGWIGYNQAALLIDTDWSMYSVEVEIAPAWVSNVTVSQVYASPHNKNAWAHLAGIGWRKIDPLANDGVTNVLAMFAIAVAKGRKVTVLTDADRIYQAYLL